MTTQMHPGLFGFTVATMAQMRAIERPRDRMRATERQRGSGYRGLRGRGTP